MENPFEQILSNDTLPEIIKARVMDDINPIKLGFDLANLFVVNTAKIIHESIKNLKKYAILVRNSFLFRLPENLLDSLSSFGLKFVKIILFIILAWIVLRIVVSILK